MGLIAAQRMGTRKLKQLRAAGQLRAEEARVAVEEIQRHARGRLMRRSYRDMLEAHRKTLADAGTLELLGPMSEEVQQLPFSLQLIRLEIEKLESRLACSRTPLCSETSPCCSRSTRWLRGPTGS